MAHGTPYQHHLLAVIGAPIQNRSTLHKHYTGLCWIHTSQSALPGIELIPKHPDSDRHAVGASPAKRQALRASAAA